ncbi:MAG TPA: glycosyltransferase family A protein, partial [Polyangiaceae bacterium]
MEVTPVQFRSLGAHRNVPMPVPNLTRIPPDPHVSCLCVTENRQAFMPWLLWNFDRQTWRKRELIIVDSSDPPVQIPKRRDIRVLRVPTGTSLGKKRNVALEAARGQVIAWFDDDDWQHPARLSTLVPLLREHARKLGACFIGPSHSYFLDLYSGYCQTYKVDGYAIFNGSVYYKDEVAFARFPENVLRTEDTQWISSILRSRK